MSRWERLVGTSKKHTQIKKADYKELLGANVQLLNIHM